MVYILSQQFYELIKNFLFSKADPGNSSAQAEGTISIGDPEVLLKTTKFHICIEPVYKQTSKQNI